MPAGVVVRARKPCVRLSETGDAFARGYLRRVETVIAFAGEKWVFLACQVPGFVETCLGRFLSCCCVLVFCLLRCDAAQGEVGAACVVPVDPG